ncbi:MAG: hypothetical protein AB7S26_35640 [Sandaracinaceae bacterium]
MHLERVSEGPVHCFAGLGNVLLSLYWGAPDARVLEDRIPWVERTMKRYEKGGLFVVVCSTASGTLPGTEFREKSRQQALQYRGHIGFSASVLEGDQLLTGLARTFLRGLALVAGQGVETAFFEDVPRAAAWVEPRSQPLGGPTADLMVSAIKLLRLQRERERGGPR